MLKKTWMFGAVCLLLMATSLSAQTKDASCSAFSGTWYGSFRVLTPDGRSTRDNAVIVLTGDCRNITGSAGSNIDQQSPISRVQFTGDEIRFHMEAMGGLDFQLKRQRNHLVGTASGKVHADIDVRPAPGLLPHDQLMAEITDADRKLFEAFDTCDIDAYASYLSPDLEFYHDQGGKTGYQEQLDSLRQRCGEGLVLRRELAKDSLVVNAAPGFGAIEAATHQFYAKQKDGAEHLDATAKFTEIWTKASGSWKLVRVISYDHQ
jgi:ketosteroid isomerase-like protein